MVSKKARGVVERIVLASAIMAVTALLLSFVRPSPMLTARMLGDGLVEETLESLAERGVAGTVETPLQFAVEGDGTCEDEIGRLLASRPGLVPTEDRPATLRCSCAIDGDVLRLVTVSGTERIETSADIPDFRAVLPPIVAVVVALALRNVQLALLMAIWSGALLAFGIDPTLGMKTVIGRYLWGTLVDQFNFSILLFTLSLVGMVQVANRAGGGQGLARAVGRLARSARSSKLAASLLGLLIFFDDYSNTVVVGTTIRTLTDRFRVSREKLAYIVDSTSAPVAGIALVSTWIGYEVGLFQELSTSLGIDVSGYGLFLQVLPLRFYCFGAIFLVILTSALGRDFGPMLRAERRAARTGELVAPGSRPIVSRAMQKVAPKGGIRPWWPTVVVPVAVSLVAVVGGMILEGGRPGSRAAEWYAREGPWNLTWVRLCFEGADAAFVLLVASLAGTWAALTFAVSRPFTGGDISPKRTAWWELLLPLPAGGLTGLVICAIHAGSSIDVPGREEAARIPSIAYLVALVSSPEGRIVLGTFLALALICTGVLLYRILVERRGRLSGMSFPEASMAWAQGLRSMAYAVSILVMAWAIRRVCDDLGTSTFIVSTLGNVAKPWLIPSLTFFMGAIVAFSTGTSWGTMGILIPTLMPFAYYMGGMPLLVLSMGAVLDGAIFGDHCSPISDTTVLSSIATGCDHIDHVKTQIPYAVVTFSSALLAGYLPLGLGVPIPVEHIALAVILMVVARFVGRRIAAGKAS